MCRWFDSGQGHYLTRTYDEANEARGAMAE